MAVPHGQALKVGEASAGQGVACQLADVVPVHDEHLHQVGLMPVLPFDCHLDVSVEVGREGSQPLAGAVGGHLARHPPAPTQGRAGGEEVTPRQESQP